MMKSHRPHFGIGWIAAVIAVASALILIVDIAEKQYARNEPHIATTQEAAKGAGASVAPTDPERDPGTTSNSPSGKRDTNMH